MKLVWKNWAGCELETIDFDDLTIEKWQDIKMLLDEGDTLEVVGSDED